VYDLAIAGATSGDPKFTLANTHVEPGSFAYGAANRNGELTFQSVRKITANVLAPLWTIGNVA
ncbi:MAG: hypothetical protein WC661_22190, partial [Opitutaceae bacterium]